MVRGGSWLVEVLLHMYSLVYVSLVASLKTSMRKAVKPSQS